MLKPETGTLHQAPFSTVRPMTPSPATVARTTRQQNGFSSTLKNVMSAHEKSESPEVMAAHEYFKNYLIKNSVSAGILEGMRPIIEQFRGNAPRVFASKCIDGRAHGSKGIGFPPGTVEFSRTEGNKVDLGLSNTRFHQRVNAVIFDAERNTPGMPPLYFAFGHTSKLAHKCAAHGEDDAAAMAAVAEQASTIRKMYGDRIYPIHGMTNTDDVSKTMVFENGTVLSTDELIQQLRLKHPTDVFTPEFLDAKIDDLSTSRHIDDRLPRELLEGKDAPMYQDLRTALSMEAYLLQNITQMQRSRRRSTVIRPEVITAINEILLKVQNLPETLRAPLLYKTSWNISHALYQRNRLDHMDAEERHHQLEHSEELVAYGEGFELHPRNKVILAKTGRGDDTAALGVAKKVLTNNRGNMEAHGHPQKHSSLVHANVQVTGTLDSFDAFNHQVASQLGVMLRNVYEVFGDDVQVLTTYSHRSEKRFYPVTVNMRDKRENYAEDITAGMKDTDFNNLELQEKMYTAQRSKEAAQQAAEYE
jgi:hypothetical protein